MAFPLGIKVKVLLKACQLVSHTGLSVVSLGGQRSPVSGPSCLLLPLPGMLLLQVSLWLTLSLLSGLFLNVILSRILFVTTLLKDIFYSTSLFPFSPDVSLIFALDKVSTMLCSCVCGGPGQFPLLSDPLARWN